MSPIGLRVHTLPFAHSLIWNTRSSLPSSIYGAISCLDVKNPARPLARIFHARFEVRKAARSPAQHDVPSEQLADSRSKRLQTRSGALADSGLPNPDVRGVKQRLRNREALVRQQKHLLAGVDLLPRFLR